MNRSVNILSSGLATLALIITVSSNLHAEPWLYVDDASGVLGKVDVSTGSVQIIGNLGATLTDIAFDPTGNLYGLSWTNFYTIDLTTGAATLVGPHGIGNATAMVFGPDGTAYSAGYSDNWLYTVNTQTGVGTKNHNTGYHGFGDLAFNGGNLFMSTDTYDLVKIDLTGHGTAQQVMPLGMTTLWGSDTAGDGFLYGVAGTSVYKFDLSAHTLTSMCNYAGHGLGAAYGASWYPTPEPSTVTMLSVGAISVLIFTLRRQKRVTRN
jgi:hypothetical protein